MNRTGFLVASAVIVGGLVAAAVFWPKERGVTLYCATDNELAQPVLDEFEKTTGIHVKAEWDTEASKSIGLPNKLKFERSNPRCDVFWNNEILHTVRLADDGLFEAYASPSAADIPAEFKDAGGLWTGFAARPRILIVSADKSMWPGDARPSSMNDLVDPKWKNRAVMAKPLTGTTLSHCVMLMTVLGPDGARKWFDGLFANDVNFTVGNGHAAKYVGNKQAAFGFTDIDDFHAIERAHMPVEVVYPDQGPGEVGTLLIPNTVALVRGGPEPEMGRRLVDFLLSKRVEQMLAEGDGAQVPLRPDVPRPAHVKVAPKDFRAMKVDWKDAAAHFDERFDQLQALWTK